MRIAFTGDLFLGGDLEKVASGNPVKVSAFNMADIRVVNLEQAVGDSTFVAAKGTLHTTRAALSRLVSMRVDVAGLANNHIQDKGTDGLVDTVANVRAVGVATAGAGANLGAARTPAPLTQQFVLLAYCDFDRPYLKQVATAAQSEPGTAPLRYESIEADLMELPTGQQAILYFHWGQEHLPLPPERDIRLAKALLKLPQVAGIVGMHSHRIQGVLKHGDKRAYMSVGNFLFPNFYMAPPTLLCDEPASVQGVRTTRQYHSVYDLTYKKWYARNRTSLIVMLDTDAMSFDHVVSYQEDDSAIVRDAAALRAARTRLTVTLLSQIMRLPRPLYIPLQNTVAYLHRIRWRTKILIFKVRQLGLVCALRLAADRINLASRKDA